MIYKQHAHKYQLHATEHILDCPGAGLFMEMGLGKTAAVLDAICHEMKYKILVIAPKQVALNVWDGEIEKWKEFRHLNAVKIMGTVKERLQALENKTADIYIINVDLIDWLVAHLSTAWDFTWVIIDELSKFKSAKSKRFKALRSVRPKIKKITGLTGTPMPNSLVDLWSQLYLLDRGLRLGDSFKDYVRQYFNPGLTRGHVILTYNLQKPEKGTKEEKYLGSDINAKEIYDKIGDICISMKAKDYLELPKRIDVIKQVSLSNKVKAAYDEFEEEAILELLESDEAITASNAAVLAGKLLQYANGAIYDEKKKWHKIHDEKLQVLDDVIEDAQGQPVLIFTAYKHDAERIQKRYGKRARQLKTKQDIDAWNLGLIDIAYCHPASMGHGVNLQAGGNIIIWYGLNWSLELYMQANARLYRQGQVKPVTVIHLLCKGTMDIEVYKALTRKEAGQSALMSAVKARIKEYRKNAKAV